MAEPKVQIAIEAKATGSFATEFAKISAQAKQAGDKISSAMSGIKNAAAALGVGLSAAGFVMFVKGAIDAADKLNDLSKVTGVSATALGGIGFAAQQAGTDLEGVAKAFGKLNLNIADALAGNAEAVETFRKLGLSVAELRNLKGDEVLVRLANTFASFEDDANKAAAANAVFGKTFQSILPLLDEGGESLRKNIGYFERYSGVTDDLVRASDQFNDALTKLQLLNRAFANHLAAALLPSLQRLVEYLVESKEKSNDFATAASAVIEPLKVLAVFGLRVALTFAKVGELIGAAGAALSELGRGNLAGAKAVFDAYQEGAEKSLARFEAMKSAIEGVGRVGGDVLTGLQGGAGTGGRRNRAPNFGNAGAKAASAGADDFARALERVAKMAAEADLELAGMFSTQEITGAQKALAALTSSDEWKKFTAPQQAELTARLQAIDAIQRETLEWKKKNEEQEKSIKLFQEEQQAQQRAVEQFTGSLGQYADENSILERQIALVGQDDLARQKLAETIQYEALVKQALLADDQAGLAILDEQFKKRIALIDQLGAATQRFAQVQQINAIFADAFTDSILSIVDGTKSLKDAFKDMERAIVQSISRIAAQNLSDALFGVGPGKSGGPGEIFAKLFGGGGGGGFDIWKWILGLFTGGGGGGGDILTGLQGFAAGGNPAVGRFSLVGERGPELIFPRAPMTVAPLTASGSGPVNITQHVTVMPGADTRSARQVAAKVRDATVLAIKDR